MKNKTILSAFLGLAVVFSSFPYTALAKENGKDKKSEVKTEISVKKENKDNDKEDKKNENSSCLQAFGHLIAPGWIKKNSTTTSVSGCFLPNGIAKKLFGKASTTPPAIDTTAPIISNISVRSGSSFAVVTWNTNEKTSGKIYFGTTSPLNLSDVSTKLVSTTFKSTWHFVFLTNLSASTTYHLIINAKDSSGNNATSSEVTFSTDGGTIVVVDNTAPVISNVSTSAVGTSTLSVSWNTNENANSKLYYSTTSPVNTSANFVSNASLVTSHTLSLTGLATGTPYFLMIESKDSSNNTATSSQFSTTTLSGL